MRVRRFSWPVLCEARLPCEFLVLRFCLAFAVGVLWSHACRFCMSCAVAAQVKRPASRGRLQPGHRCCMHAALCLAAAVHFGAREYVACGNQRYDYGTACQWLSLSLSPSLFFFCLCQIICALVVVFVGFAALVVLSCLFALKIVFLFLSCYRYFGCCSRRFRCCYCCYTASMYLSSQFFSRSSLAGRCVKHVSCIVFSSRAAKSEGSDDCVCQP